MTDKMVEVKERIWCEVREGKVVDILSKYETLLAEALEDGADEESVRIEWIVEYGWGNEGEDSPYIIYNRPETEKEREIREKREARQRDRTKAQREKQKADAEKRELKELNRLLKKYKEDIKSE